MHGTIGTWLLVGAIALAAVAAVLDCRTGRVSNWLTLGLLPLAPVAHAIALRGTHGPFGLPGPLFGALLSLAGAVLCALVPYVMFRLSWFGGADVKLLATLGALLTAHYGLEVELVALLLAAIFVPARLAFRGRLFRTGWSLATGFWSLAARLARAFTAPASHPATEGQVARPQPTPALAAFAFDSVRFSPFVFLGVASLFVLTALAPGWTR